MTDVHRQYISLHPQDMRPTVDYTAVRVYALTVMDIAAYWI